MSAEVSNVAVSVQGDPNANVVLTVWTDIVADDALRVTLSPDRAAILLRDLTNQVTVSLLAAATSIARGDCATCLNTRMIQIPTGPGRSKSEHCPDCTIEGRHGFPLVPQVGGGVA